MQSENYHFRSILVQKLKNCKINKTKMTVNFIKLKNPQ